MSHDRPNPPDRRPPQDASREARGEHASPSRGLAEPARSGGGSAAGEKRVEQSSGRQLAELTAELAAAREELHVQNSYVVDLESTLSEKNDLVTVLTERLEQAAEQLDRVRREGNRVQRGPSTSSAAALETQQVLTEQLQALIQQWDDVEIGSAFGRLEMQIGALHDLVESRLDALSGQQPAPPARAPEKPAASTPPPRPAAPAPVAGDETDWDQIKARLLAAAQQDAASDQPSESEKAAPSQQPSQPRSGESGTDRPAAAESLPDIEAPEAPQPVDYEAASRQELIDALEQRDQYISYLIRRQRQVSESVSYPTDWEALAAVPEDLIATVERLKKQLDETLRMSEIDLSLERARLSRSAMRLEALQSELAAKSGKAEAEAQQEDDTDSRRERRWRRMLGGK